MGLHITAPTEPALAAEYRRQGLWRSIPQRAGLEQVAEHDPNRLAVVDNFGTWTFGQLRRQTEAAVGSLLAAGVEPDDPVVIVAPNLRESVAAVLATVRSNGVAVVIDRRCGRSDLANAIASSGSRHVVMPAALRSSLRIAEHDVRVLDLEALGTGPSESDWTEPDVARPRIVIFTSGTTQRSKGVIHTLETLDVGTRNLATSLAFTESDRPFLSSPIGTITGLLQVLMCANGGAGIVLENQFDPAASLARIEHSRATVVGGAPVILEQLFDEYRRLGVARTSLRRIALGGTMIPRSVLEVAIEHFLISPTRVYGAAEMGCHTATTAADSLEQRLFDDGVPMPGAECRLGQRFDDGHELYVRGPNLFQGYLYDEDNDGAFVDGWYRTGDLVQGFDEGRIKVRGRLKDVVARKGLKISLAEVDDAARTIVGALESAAFCMPDAETGERVALAVVPDGSTTITYRAVIESLTEFGLARRKLPEQIVIWDEPLPRNASRKILRTELAAGAPNHPVVWAARLEPVPTGPARGISQS